MNKYNWNIGGKGKKGVAVTCPTSLLSRLAWCALRYYFAGGSPYTLIGKYGISHTVTCCNGKGVSCCPTSSQLIREMNIEYPEFAEGQDKIALQLQFEHFFRRNRWHIDSDLKAVSEGGNRCRMWSIQIFMQIKGKFGLNCQAVSDVHG